MAELSPMMQQYLEIKNQHKDEILFYRIGDFYEMFFDDAVTASRELDLTLTGKQCGLAERAPMCGVPFHSYEGYVARLIAKGYKVAICEQVEDPAKAKGLVKRDIIRVVTPGTVIESSMLQDDRNNYIASLYLKGKKAGLCFADVSTGTAHITELTADKIAPAVITELCRYHPSEVLLNPGLLDCREVTAYIKKNMSCSVELVEDERYAPGLVASALEEQFGRDWPQTTGMVAEGLVRFAMAALLEYLHDTQIKGVERLKTVITYNEAQFMRLSQVTRANLELTETLRGREKRGTLLWVLDKTKTAMGARMLRSWLERPLLSVRDIDRRADCVERLVNDTVTREELVLALSGISDMERLMSRIVYGSAGGRDVVALRTAMEKLPAIKALLAAFPKGRLHELYSTLDTLDDLAKRIADTLRDELPFSVREGEFIRDGFHPEVDRLRGILHGGKGLMTSMEAQEKEKTGIRTLKIGYNKVFGYYIEVSNSFKDQVPDTYIRKQTLVNGERYITQELKNLESDILTASDRVSALEYELFTDLRTELAGQVSRIQASASAVAELDSLCSLASVAVSNGYCRPTVDDSGVLEIHDGRHPVVEQMISNHMFISNDTYLDNQSNRISIITGPNMAGKSTYMRQVALLVLMTQMGSFIPARQATICPVDKIFTRVGASDDLASGQSTFMVEMTEVANILRNATKESLIILDEIGRGTSTFDGLSIAWAVIEHIANTKLLGAKTLFATHYHELTELEGKLASVDNYCIAVKEQGEDIVFLRKIVKGGADRSYGIQVAKLAGVPDMVIDRAKEIVEQLSDNDITEKVQSIAIDNKGEGKAKKQPKYDEVDLAQMSLFDTVTDEDVLKELMEIEVTTLTPLDALNTLYRLQNKLKNRWNG